MSRLTVSSVEAERIDVSTSYQDPQTVLGRVTVELVGGRYSVRVTDWPDPIPNVGDEFELTLVVA